MSKSPAASPAAGADHRSEIPRTLQHGVPMLKVTKKKVKDVIFWLTEDQAIRWQSKREGRVPIDQIREVRYGPGARSAIAQLPSSLANSNRWISVIYIAWPSTWKSLCMIAPNDDIFKAWVDTIASLLGSIKTINHVDGCIGILGALERLPMSKPASWSLDSAVDPHHAVTFSEVASMCAKIGIVGSPEGQVRQAFERSDIGGKGHLTFEEFRTFVALVRQRQDLDGIFDQLAPTGRLYRDDFVRFCAESQKISPDAAVSFFTGLAISQDEDQYLDLKSFSSFLSSTKNAVIALEHSRVHQDMTRPLPEYYISSSHNTYLVGHQWKGDSTVEGYIRALLSGCRSVELDCWNGDAEPVVYHGKTLTSKVSVRDICVAIKRYGFMASPYPIIISAEIHCSRQQQISLVNIMKETFGAALVTTPLSAFAAEGPLPSPEHLRYRILLKAKRPVETVTEACEGDLADLSLQPSSAAESTESDFDRDGRRDSSAKSFFGRVSDKVSSIVDPNALSPPSSARRSGSFRTPRRSSSVDSVGSNATAISSTSSGPTVVPELAEILVYTAGVKYQGFTKLVAYKSADVFSVSEKTATKIQKTAPADFIKHNRTHLSRVYPQGTRLTSTNYDPQRFWAMGCQLVALNWQTCDTGFMVNSAMFARNGRCGYVLKPEILQPKGKDLLWTWSSHKLDIGVISGQHLPTMPDVALHDMRLFVEVKLHLPPAMDFKAKDGGRDAPHIPSATAPTKSFRTRLISGNTFNPIWNEPHSVNFSCHTALMDLAFLEVELRHEPTIGDDVCIAQWCGSLSAMQQGYRYIPLSDAQMSQYLFSTLFLRLDLDDTTHDDIEHDIDVYNT